MLFRSVLGCDLAANDERAEYMRATLECRSDGTKIATPFRAQDSSLLVPLADAHCLVVREPFAPEAQTGSPCDILNLQF